MTPEALRRRSTAVAALAALAFAQPCTAQAPVVVWPAAEPEAAGRAELWARRVERALEREGARVVTDEETWAAPGPGFDARLIEELDILEFLLDRARQKAADLDEIGALAALAEAQRETDDVLTIPGGVSWVAEVEVQLAITAYELGQVALARAALERAATLDRRRTLQPAEAPPELVAIATEIGRAARSAPTSSFRVSVDGVRPGEAQVFLDDEYVGPAPVRVEASAGLHVLRVEARGRRPWASRMELLPGTRADVGVALSLSRAVEVARALRDDVRHVRLDEIPPALAELDRLGIPIEALVLVDVGQGAFDRAALVRCVPSGCGVTRRLEGDVPAHRADLAVDAPTDSADDVRAWLEEIPDVEGPGVVPPGGDDFWSQPWPWLIGGGIVLGVGAGVTAAVLVPTEPTTVTPIVVLPIDFANP